MKKDLGGAGKTLEGEGTLLKEGSLSLQTSLILPELPHKPPAITRAKIWFAFVDGGGLMGKFWLVWEVRICCKVRLSRSIGG